jgi:formate dehydrogenase subunit gamma
VIETKTAKEDMIRRFVTARILEHWLAVATFAVLVVTGLSQKFFTLAVSQWLILTLGGIDTIRLIHRLTGIIFAIALSAHVIIGASGVILRKWQPSMMITTKDFNDAIDDIKYYIGLKNSPARCDRYSYKQKFEYWGILTGGLLMVATGLALWFPALTTLLLPGELIPVAKALHSNEALVIVLLIAIWHIYNAIFSPEVFPLDTSIFTGYISRDRMLREHPIELERMEDQAGNGMAEQGGEDIRHPGTEETYP